MKVGRNSQFNPDVKRHGRQFRPEVDSLVTAKENPQGYGINFWKNPAKIIIQEINRLNNSYCATAQLRLLFEPKEGVILEDSAAPENVVISQAKYIARAFVNAGYSSMTIPADSRYRLEGLRPLLDLADQEKVHELATALNISALGYLMTPAENGAAFRLIPGEYKHYTDEPGLQGIMGLRQIMGSRRFKGGEDGFWVSLSRLSLAPDQVRQVFFTEEERQNKPESGFWVVAFDFRNGSMVVRHNDSDRSLEGWVYGNLSLDQVEVTYSGPNFIAV